MTPDLSSLTQKQKRVYFIIESFIKQKGIPPTVREIADAIGEKTPATVQGILNRMERKGVIKRKTGAARSIQLVSEESNYGIPVFIPVVKKLTSRTIADITNMYNIEKYQPLPDDLVAGHKNCFIISCTDNSLRDSGINYQDLLIISCDAVVKDGDIVLVLYKNHAIIRKIFASEDENIVFLKGDSNPIGRDKFDKSEISIAGKLIGKYTRF